MDTVDDKLIKHDAIIQADNRSLNHIDKKIINLLLLNASLGSSSREIHEYQFSDITKDLKWKSRNDPAIIESLEKLVSTKIGWNILGNDKMNDWTVSTIIASYRVIKNSGVFQYSYSAHFKQVLSIPEIISKIDINIQNKIKSKYTLNLWELLKTQIKKNPGLNKFNSDYFPINELKNIIGTVDDYYNEFKYFKAKILVPSIAEINSVTDIEVTECNYKRNKRSIIAISFEIMLKCFDNPTNIMENTEEENLNEFLKKQEYDIIYHELKTWNLSDKNILSRFKSISINDLQSSIQAATEFVTKSKKTKNAQMITRAINDGWQPNPCNSDSIKPIIKKKINVAKDRNNSTDSTINDDSDYSNFFEKAAEQFSALSEEQQIRIEEDCFSKTGNSRMPKDSDIYRTTLLTYFMNLKEI